MAKSLYLIDTHYQIYRAFYGLGQPLTSPTGEPTAAVHVFFTMLFALMRDRKPDYLAMAMDVSDETTFRRDLDPDYKAHRDPAPEGLITQADRILSCVEAMNIPIVRVPGFEADDLMATIAEQLRDQEIDVYLVSKDKDLEQLITDRVRLYDAAKDIVIDREKLAETKGYSPEQAVEIQTLVGDSTDNIPGVPGIGPKTAVKLVSQYGSAKAVLDHADELTPKMRERVNEFAPTFDITRQLVTLRRDVPCDFDLGACEKDRIDATTVRSTFRSLGLNRLNELLDVLMPESASAPDDLFAEQSPPDSPPADRGKYELIDTMEKLDKFAKQLVKQKAFAFDTETTSLRPVDAQLVGISIGWKEGEAYFIPVLAAMGKLLPVELVTERLKPAFENPEIAKVGHNLKFDTLVLRQIGIETKGLSFDTLLASFVLDPMRRSHSLDALAKGYLNHDMIPISDLIGKGRERVSMDQLDTNRLCEYAAEDADFTWRLREILESRMSGSPLEPLFRDTEMPLIEVLVEMENNGVALDVPFLKKLGREMEERLLDLTRQVHAAAQCEFNIDSPKQLATVLFDDLGFEVVRKTKTGRSTDADTLAAIAAQTEHPVPRLVLEYRELAKLKNTYVDTLPRMICERTGRVHASFNQTGAVTGRLSSSDPNLQNIPIRTETGKQIRQAFIAGSPDHVLLVADYSQIELRVLAHFSQDEALISAFEEGIDVHRAVAAQVNAVPLEEVTPAQRSAAKAVNFGIVYGQTPFGLGKSLGISTSEAKQFIDSYFERYLRIRSFIDHCIEEARTKGYAQTILGRRRPIPELTSRNRGQVGFGQRIAVNTVVQGSAADLIKRAMIDIHREIRAGTCPARMLLQVHDELVFEVPEADLDRATTIIRDKMENPLELNVPIVADISWGRTWADAK